MDERSRIWRRLLSTNPPIWVKSIRIVESDVFEEQEISFAPAMCVVGSHGSGKTLLLRLLEGVFGFDSETPPFIGARRYSRGIQPVTGIVEIVVVIEDRIEKRVVDLSMDNKERFAVWSDLLDSNFWPTFNSAAELASNFNWYFQNFGWDASQILDERKFKASELTALRHILGKRYESVHVRTVLVDTNDEGDWYAKRPYVTAVSEGRPSDSGTFSLGELWVHQVLWEQARLEPGCLFLLDEPESFLALRGHRPFIDEVARRALERRIQLVVATHSPQVLMRFPVDAVRMCIRGAEGKIRVVRPESLEQVNQFVRMEIPVTTLVLVEDALAAAVLRGIFGHLNIAASAVDVVPAGGKDKLIAGVRALSASRRVRVVGVLDADQRAHVGTLEGLFALPGEADPEQELFKYALRERVAVAAALNRSEDALLAAIDGYEFLEHQYWPGYLARQLGMDQHLVTNLLIRLWLGDPLVRAQAIELAAALIES
ncbi:ATP-dependent nuclease [Micromonospora chalcea]|uniref:ATP-dependent nuclease n=1 Tax=Micromonospora chalcea TaxID=1874 RepID=UPI0037CB2C84